MLYLGRPREAVIAEAYRHLVDPVEGMRPELVPPRRVLTVQIQVERALDLRSSEALRAVGLDAESVRAAQAPCRRVAQVAHSLGMRAILAQSATALGETLAVFTDREFRAKVIEEEVWAGLPPDPRMSGR